MGAARGPVALPRGAVVARPRLLDRLGERFRARLTTVVGAAGSGKTTLLGQVLASQCDGLDVWYPCSLPDRDPDRLIDGVVAALAEVTAMRSPEQRSPVAAMREMVLSALPDHVCLILDDVHVLGDTKAIARLLGELPSNGHLLLAGRSLPELSTARLDLLGDLVEVDEHDLMLTDEELVAFANARGVDVSLLDGADGWPAFVELACLGVPTRPQQYLEQESIAHLDEERRSALAAFAFAGGGDDTIATAATGVGLAELLDGLPLVRWTGDEAQLHDLWIDALHHVLTDDERRRVVAATADPLLDRRKLERVVLLGAAVEGWVTVVRALTAAIRDGVDHGMRSNQLTQWVAMLPAEVAEGPAGLLASGVIERDRDPTSQRAADLLADAADGFRTGGDDDMELVALLQLGYVARVSGQPDRLAPVIERVEELAKHFAPARPYLAFGAAWTALAQGRPDLQLAAMESIVGADLPAVWEQSRDHLLAHALFNLGRPLDGLAVAPGADDSLPIPVPGALMTRSQCLWYSGQPERAIRERHGLDGRHGARDRFIAGAWVATMEAFAGRLDEARAGLVVARSHAGELPAMLVAAQVIFIELLIRLVEGDEDGAATELASVLEAVPLGGGVSEQALRSNLAIPYVLVPATRTYWDSAELGPSIRVSREIARAFVEAREGDHRRLSSMEFPEPGVVASTFTVNWAIEFALHALDADRSEGRRLVAWLCEQWGGPARAALQALAAETRYETVAKDALSRTPLPPTEAVRITVLGRSSAWIGGYETADPNWRRERVRAVVAWLVVHRGGTREQLAGALWPELSGERAGKNLRTTLNYIHHVLEPRRTSGDAAWFVQVDGPNIRLNPRSEVDAWRFVDLLDAADAEQRAGRPTESLPLLLEAVSMYGGDLATDLDHSWLDLERIHLRSRFVRASCSAGDLLTATHRPSDAIDLLRGSLAADPWHERSYLALADAYTALGDTTSAAQVLELAVAQLGELTRQTGASA